jgi:hypothetical protein
MYSEKLPQYEFSNGRVFKKQPGREYSYTDTDIYPSESLQPSESLVPREAV